jgi:hypothetical protein
MTYTEILTDAWNRADDTIRPYKWSDTDWISYLNHSMDELCLKTQILVDSKDTDICNIVVTPGSSSYPLHEKIVNILDVWDNTTGYSLQLYTVGQMSGTSQTWRSLSGTADSYILDDTTGYILFSPTPDTATTIKLRVARLVKEPATADTLTSSPDLPLKYHRFLVDGVLYQAYSKNDAETRDPAKIAFYKESWQQDIDLIYQAAKRYNMSERVIAPQYGFI